MRVSLKSAAQSYRLAIILAAAVLLTSFTIRLPGSLSFAGMLAAVFIAVTYNFPLYLFNYRTNIVHVICLGVGLIYGPLTAAWSIVLGTLLQQFVVAPLFSGRQQRPPVQQDQQAIHFGFGIGVQVFPVLVSMVLTGLPLGLSTAPFGRDPQAMLKDLWVYIVLASAFFALLHGLLFLIDFRLRQSQVPVSIRGELENLALLEFLPLPFVIITAFTYPLIGFGSLLTLGGSTSVVAMFIYGLSKARRDLERRVRELSILNQVSQVMRSSLDLEKLLDEIQRQVTHIFDVDNFYVAIFDDEAQRLSYPLAVKHGKRSHWSPRSLEPDRLTDRVVHDGKPILFIPEKQNDLGSVGLPPSEERPQAWMGVPLVASEKTLGCLAVYSLNPSTQFTLEDQNLLTILSGQVSVAIENAMLYEQTQRRAAQLETLNRISALITASLDPQEVLAQVCRSVAEVGGGQHSAIFLVESERGQVTLAYSFGLSESFSQCNQRFSVAQSGRMRCLRTGRPVMATTLADDQLEAEYIESLRVEGIQAFEDFPLSTPEGQIGILSVFFDHPHTSRTEEVDLLQTFASQAALAVSNARQYAHTDMALSQRANQLSILETVGRELAAAISSERLFEMILNYALEFTNSNCGELSLLNQQTQLLEVKAERGYPENRSIFSIKDGVAGKAAAIQKPVNVGNVLTDPDFLDYTNGRSRSQLSIPLIREGRVLGVLTLESERENAYSANDESFIDQLATQAAVAVLNAELYSETQRILREQSTLYQVGMQLVTNPELEMILQTVAHSMEASLQTSSVGIYLWDERRGLYDLRHCTQSASRTDCQLPPEVPFADLESIQPQLVKTGPLRLNPRRGRELLGGCMDCQALVFPLIANKQRLGMVLMHVAKGKVVKEEPLQLLRSIVQQVAISLQNALLFEDISHGRDRLDAVLNSVGEGILMMNPSGSILLANQFIEKITGLPRLELIGSPLANLSELTLRALGYNRAEVSGLIQNPELASTSSKVTIQNTETKPERVLERSTLPVWGTGGNAIGWMILLRDVTEEYQMTQARELITSTLVHDLRSPVSAVLSSIDLIEDNLLPDRKDDLIEQALRVTRNSANRVLGLIEALLDIARMQSGRMDINIQLVDMHHLVTNILMEFVTQANEYGVILRNEAPADLPKVSLDANKITRVITNLVDNALKFTPAGGQVVVSACLSAPDTLIVQISDTGSGIPEEYRQKIFDRFTQVPGSRGRRRGSGLGLTFCRLAIEAHGGTIWVEGRSAPATGSIFSFTIPLNGPDPLADNK